MKAHYELMSARKFYGRHVTGTALLRNGVVEFHGKRSDALRLYKKWSKR